METERKILVISRHGKTPNGEDGLSLDSLLPESVNSLYEKARAELGDETAAYNILPHASFLRHSDKVRTLNTGRSILAGIFGFEPKPEREEDLEESPHFRRIETAEDEMLSYENLKFNEDAIITLGLPQYIERWFAQPDATKYEGVEITPFNELLRTRRPCLADAVRILVRNKDIGVLGTHASIADALTMIAVNSARKTPVTSFDEIGGQFEKEDFATLRVDYNPKSQIYEARLSRKEQDYKVDIGELLN